MTTSHELKWYQKAGYGFGDFGLSATLFLIQFYLFYYYSEGLGLSPVYVGTALALGVVWDAISDPLMGAITDRTRTRIGRYLPYLLAGGPAVAIAVTLLFWAPTGLSEGALFAYLFGNYLLMNTALTLLGMPHLALGGVLVQAPEERTSLYGWRLIWGTLGLMAGLAAPRIAAANLESGAPEGVLDRRWGAIIVAVLVLISTAVTTWAVWKPGRRVAPAGARQRFRLSALWKTVWISKAFRVLVVAFVLLSIGRAMNGVLALYYYVQRLQLDESAVQLWVLMPFAASIMLSVPIWLLVSRRFGKAWPGWAAMMGLGLWTSILYPLLPPGVLWGPVLAALLGGIPVGAIVLFESMLADVAADEGKRDATPREGIFFGWWRMAQKLANSGGLLMTTVLLWLIDWDPDSAATTEQLRYIAWFFGPGVGLFFMGGALVFLSYPGLRQRRSRHRADLSRGTDTA